MPASSGRCASSSVSSTATRTICHRTASAKNPYVKVAVSAKQLRAHAKHAADIVQPDCTKCGGLTEAWRIAWMAYDHNAQWVPHGWNTAIGLAADLQLAGAMPVAKYVEFLSPSPYIDELIVDPFRPDADGMLTIPDKPGLGIDLNRDALGRYAAR